MDPTIAVLIPCYNEAASIAQVVSDFRTELPGADIIVCDNRSTDDTAAVAAAAGATVITEPRPGKGNAMRTLFAAVDADCYVMVDGDDTYPAAHVHDMCRKVLSDGADLVLGDRLSSTYFTVNSRPGHNFGNRLVRGLINRLFSSHVQDIMTGYRAMSRKFVRNFPMLSKGFEIETEMTIHALDKNFRVEVVPIQYRERAEGNPSKLNTLTDGFRVLKTIFLLFVEYRPFFFFSIVSLMLALLSVCMLVPVFSEYFATGLVPRFPTLIVAGFIMLLAILLWVCGLILEVIRKSNLRAFELQLIHNSAPSRHK